MIHQQAYKLYVIAILRCAYPKAVNRDLKFYYETSFMSELFKKVGLSESLLPDFFEKTGRAYSNIHNFMLDRINEFKGRVQIIDGTLKSYNSDEATFSQWSRKGKVKDSERFYLTLHLWLIYQRANLSQTIPRKYAGFDYFWGLFGKCA